MEINRKFRKKNKLIYIGYEVPKNGRILSVVDGERNTIGGVYLDHSSGKTEFIFKSGGEEIFRFDTLRGLKQELRTHKEYYIDYAYRRRAEKDKQKLNEEKFANKQIEEYMKEKEMEYKAIEKASREYVRDMELKQIRERKEKNRGQSLER